MGTVRLQQAAEKAVNGDMQAYSQLFTEFRPLALWYMRTHFPEQEAQDLQQEAALRIHRYFDTYDPEIARFSTWSLSILRNLAKSQRTKINRAAPYRSLDEEVFNDGPKLLETIPASKTVNGDGSWTDAQKHIDALIMDLKEKNPNHYQAHHLRVFKEFTYEEIASIMEIPKGTVKTYIWRAREYLSSRRKNDKEFREVLRSA